MSLQADLYTEFDTDPTNITAFIWWLTKKSGLSRNLRVLDMGCGPGRMLMEYARLGWHVTGMEPDPDFYASAKQAAAHHPSITVKHGSFEDLIEEHAYDLITAINDPFAYVLDIPKRREALGRVYRALKPGGLMFLEVKNFLYKLFYDQPIKEEFGKIDHRRIAHVMQQEIDFHNARWICRDEYIVEGENRTVSKTHTLAIITLPELMYFIEQQGFEQIETYPDYGVRDPQPINDRLILISARKPGDSDI